GRDADAFHKKFTHAVAWTLWGNHRNIDERWRHNLAEMDIETVSKHQCLSTTKMRFDRGLVHALLSFVGNEDHDHVAALSCLLDCRHGKSVFLCPNCRRTAGVCRYANVHAAVSHVQRVRVSLAAVADDRDFLRLDQPRISVFFVIDVGHEISLVVISTEMTSIC